MHETLCADTPHMLRDPMQFLDQTKVRAGQTCITQPKRAITHIASVDVLACQSVQKSTLGQELCRSPIQACKISDRSQVIARPLVDGLMPTTALAVLFAAVYGLKPPHERSRIDIRSSKPRMASCARANSRPCHGVICGSGYISLRRPCLAKDCPKQHAGVCALAVYTTAAASSATVASEVPSRPVAQLAASAAAGVLADEPLDDELLPVDAGVMLSPPAVATGGGAPPAAAAAPVVAAGAGAVAAGGEGGAVGGGAAVPGAGGVAASASSTPCNAHETCVTLQAQHAAMRIGSALHITVVPRASEA